MSEEFPLPPSPKKQFYRTLLQKKMCLFQVVQIAQVGSFEKRYVFLLIGFLLTGSLLKLRFCNDIRI